MGTTHWIYKMMRDDYTIDEAIEIIRKLYHSLCIGSNKKFLYEFEVDNFAQWYESTAKFENTYPSRLIQFKMKDATQLNKILLDPTLYEKIFFYNPTSRSEKSQAIFWLTITSKSENFYCDLYLPYKTGIAISRQAFAELLSFMVTKGLFHLNTKEIKELTNFLIGFHDEERHWKYQEHTEFYTQPTGYQIKGKPRQSSYVRLVFSPEAYAQFGGYEKAAVAFHQVLTEYFADTSYFIDGTIVTDHKAKTIPALKGIDFTDLKIPIRADISNFTDFSSQDLVFIANPEDEMSIYVEDFDWKDSAPNHGDNRIELWIKDAQEYELEFNASKQIDEFYYRKITQATNEKLVSFGTA